jgi:hypothetical protein
VTTLQESQKWSEKQPAWQQDAIARLYTKPELSVQDYDDIYALLKAEHGIPDLDHRIAGRLAPDQIAAPQAADRLVQIVAIKNLRNVNALAAEAENFAPTLGIVEQIFLHPCLHP